MLKIMKKQIDVERSPVLLQEEFTEDFLDRWTIHGGKWWVDDGWLTGKNPDNSAGMIIARADYPGNILLDFQARVVLPSTHDIDVMWNGSWDEPTGKRGQAYIMGIEGWWEGKVGFERAPDYKLTACTPLFDFTPDATYHVQCGGIDGHCFIFVDGKLLLEVTDPDPIDAQVYTKIGFEAYCSFVQIRDLTVRSIYWEPRDQEYLPEFV